LARGINNDSVDNTIFSSFLLLPPSETEISYSAPIFVHPPHIFFPQRDKLQSCVF
jgi:hypothetical protein